MEHDIVIEGRVVTQRGIEDLELGVTDDRIGEVRKQGLKGSRRIRTGSCLVFPGFVDAHVHLREPGWEAKEDFRTGGEAAVHGGVTTVADMPNNPVPAGTREAIQAKSVLATKSAVSVVFYGGVYQWNLERLQEMAPVVSGYKVYLAKSTGDGRLPGEDLPRAFGAVAELAKPVGVHCEDQKIIDMKTAELREDRRPDVHCDIRPPEAEVAAVKMALASAKGFKELKLNICHASVAGSLSEVKRARAAGGLVECEATLHHLYYNRKAMLENPLLRTNPPLRREEDRLSMLEGLRSGAVTMLVTDHAPHLEDEKTSQDLSGVPGLDDYGHIVSWLLKEQGVDPVTILRASAVNPSRYLGLKDRGRLEKGARADLTVLDVRSPERVTADDVRSKCGWSPYDGVVFPGRVRWTVSGGRVLLDDFEMAV